MCDSTVDNVSNLILLFPRDPCRPNVHRAVDYTPADRNRIPADIEHLLVQPVVINDQIATVKRSVDRIFNRLTRCLLTAVSSDERFKIVSRLAEDMAAPVGIIHSSQEEISPWAIPARARR